MASCRAASVCHRIGETVPLLRKVEVQEQRRRRPQIPGGAGGGGDRVGTRRKRHQARQMPIERRWPPTALLRALTRESRPYPRRGSRGGAGISISKITCRPERLPRVRWSGRGVGHRPHRPRRPVVASRPCLSACTRIRRSVLAFGRRSALALDLPRLDRRNQHRRLGHHGFGPAARPPAILSCRDGRRWRRRRPGALCGCEDRGMLDDWPVCVVGGCAAEVA